MVFYTFAGLFEVPISQMIEPPKESRLLREADDIFIKNLKKAMVKDPSAPGATPLTLLCRDISFSNFNEKHLSLYKYEVIGGLHSFHAKSELVKEYPDIPFFKVALSEVYLELSDEEALRLAQRHNSNSHFVHKITHRDLVRIIIVCIRMSITAVLLIKQKYCNRCFACCFMYTHSLGALCFILPFVARGNITCMVYFI